MIRIGLLGASKIAPPAVIAPAAANPAFEVTAVGARDLGRARAYAEAHSIPGVAAGYAELVRREDVDVVYNALPPSAHAEWTIAALEAGKAVLCEKPFSMSVAEARTILTRTTPAFAVIDLRLEDGSGLEVVNALRAQRPDARIVMLTGYGNFATAVAAVKAGAVDYLPKPADADMVEAALMATGRDLPPPPEQPMSAERVRWEHIQRVFEQCDRNVSETAHRLNMHRRTLQRILSKRAPR